MKRIIFAVLACLAGIAMFAAPASAADSVEEAIAAMQKGSVYVAKGTEDTTSDTTSIILGYMNSKDHILVVMMPKDSTSLTNDEISIKILGSVKEPSILALYANGQVTAHTNRQYVPSDAANKVMSNASSIAVGPTETITTFVTLVHRYQAAHPEPITSTGTTTPSSPPDSSAVPYGVGGGLAIAVAVIATVVLRRKRSNANPYTLKASPTSVRDQLNRVKELMPRIKNQSVVEQLGSVVNDTEAFFRRSVRSSSRDTEREAADFQRKLKDAVVMLEKYVDIQDNPRYFDHPAQLLASGAEAVDGLATGILNAVKSSNTKSLLDYKVSSDVLSAERYK